MSSTDKIQQTQESPPPCSLSRCDRPAAGKGSYWHGPLCDVHLTKDEQLFERIQRQTKATTDELIAKVNEHLKMTRSLLLEVSRAKDDALDLFHSIADKLNEFREKVIGRLDSKIDLINENLDSLNQVELLIGDIKSGEDGKDEGKRHQLRLELQLLLDEAIVTEKCPDDMVDGDILVLRQLQETIGTFVNEQKFVKNKIRAWNSINPKAMASLSCYFTVLSASLCDRTDGFFFGKSTISKSQQTTMQPMPEECFIVFGNYKTAGYNANAFFLGIDFSILGNWNILDDGLQLLLAQCVSHLQQIFLLDNQQSVTVTDLAGTKLQSIDKLQIAAAVSMTHDMEKLYILGDGNISCLSLETCEVQETMRLSGDVKDAVSVAVSGRSLMIGCAASVYRMSLATQRCVLLWQSNGEGLKWLSDISCGFVAACHVSGKVTVLSTSGQVVKEIDLVQMRSDSIRCFACKVESSPTSDLFDFVSTFCRISSTNVVALFQSRLTCNHFGLYFISLR